jgi:hypothetical protein
MQEEIEQVYYRLKCSIHVSALNGMSTQFGRRGGNKALGPSRPDVKGQV